MPTNNFKLFDEKKANMMSDDDYAINQQRLNGVQSGVASSQLQNKTLYQTALMCYALAQIMASNGYDANDADAVSTFVNNMSRTMVQKVLDMATTADVDAGTSETKYINPKVLKNVYDALSPIKGSGEPTENTKANVGQLYIDLDTGTTFTCISVSGDKRSWKAFKYATKVIKTEIVTQSGVWKVPEGVLSADVLCIGGGGGESSNNAGGGGGGYLAQKVVDLKNVSSVNITIGAAGSKNSNGGITSFGSFLSANGGGHGIASGNNASGGDGGSGGGGLYLSGGKAQYGGGGGGGYGANGGNGGQYGGGGGGGGGGGNGGSGGQYGGNGGNGGGLNSAGKNGSNGTNTVNLDLLFVGAGSGGSGYGGNQGGGGGGGGYGGNGGKAMSFGAGGGGGYGGNGGNSGTNSGGGGGGYGGNGGNGGQYGGGGGGYGQENYGCGGGQGSKSKRGVVVIRYAVYE